MRSWFESADQLDEQMHNGERPLFLESIVPVLNEHDKQVLVIGDYVDRYFKSRNPTLAWGRDFEFLGYLHGNRAAGILASASPFLKGMIHGNTIQLSIPPVDPLSLRVPEQAMKHPRMQRALKPYEGIEDVAKALIMIGGGANPRCILKRMNENLLDECINPREVPYLKRLPPDAGRISEMPYHLYHTMFKQNETLWKKAGLNEIWEKNPSDPGNSKEAVECLAKYIAKHPTEWRKDFKEMSKDDLIDAYSKVSRNMLPTKVCSARDGLKLLEKHRVLVKTVPGKELMAPSLAHILAARLSKLSREAFTQTKQ